MEESGREILLQTVENSMDLLLNILEAFIRDMPKKLASLDEALMCGDAAAARVQAHGMKSSGRTVGAASFARLCEELEKAAASGNVEGNAGEKAMAIREEYLRIEEGIRRFILQNR